MRCASSSLGGDYPLRTRTAPLVSPRRRGSSLGSRRRGSTRVEMRYRRIVFPDYTSERDRDRKSVVWGKRVSGRVDLGGRRILKKKNKITSSQKTILRTEEE